MVAISCCTPALRCSKVHIVRRCAALAAVAKFRMDAIVMNILESILMLHGCCVSEDGPICDRYRMFVSGFRRRIHWSRVDLPQIYAFREVFACVTTLLPVRLDSGWSFPSSGSSITKNDHNLALFGALTSNPVKHLRLVSCAAFTLLISAADRWTRAYSS